MKTLKFRGFKAKWILDGTKTASTRLFDDKDLQIGDELELVNYDTGEVLAHAIISEVIEKTLEEITEADLAGHEKWDSQEEMIKTYKIYYGERVNLQTPAKIIRFKLV